MRITQTITRPDNTTAYTAADVVGNTSSIIEFGRLSPGTHMIKGARLLYGENAIPGGMAAYNLHLYDWSPTNIADNAAWTLSEADSTHYLGKVVLTLPVDLGAACFSKDDSVNMTINVADNASSVFGLLETVGGYTPVAETVHTISLDID